MSTSGGGPSGGLRPSLGARLATAAFLAVLVGAGILIFIPLAILGLAVLGAFVLYFVAYRLAQRLGRRGDAGRRNVRVIEREP